jgi:glyoxylase-like metal-dependent hydrolase (beta-lactamase superfamily II)
LPNPLYTRINEHIWVIHGEDQSRFPSGNAILINSQDKLVLIDTNPGFERVESALREITSNNPKKITDIVLSHAHLDHGRGLANIFEENQSMIHAHPDTLQRCEKKARVGLYAGIPKEEVHFFEEFGQSLGFQDKKYPDQNKTPIQDGQIIKFGNIKVLAHETFGHCVHMLDYEIMDGDLRVILSCDFDFSPVPWYGVPQRGDSIDMFIKDIMKIIKRNPSFIISSHRIEPILPKDYEVEFTKYQKILENRTDKAVSLCSDQDVTICEMKNFVYPIEKMKGKYSDAYIHCAQWWDYWLLLAHLEKAWELGKVQCCDAAGDIFLEKCIRQNKYLIRSEFEKKGLNWAITTLKETPLWSIPVKSRWRLI